MLTLFDAPDTKSQQKQVYTASGPAIDYPYPPSAATASCHSAIGSSAVHVAHLDLECCAIGGRKGHGTALEHLHEHIFFNATHAHGRPIWFGDRISHHKDPIQRQRTEVIAKN